ncbi:MAG: glycyl-radical enzyme activating protein [Desulfovibrio sp.]|nr:glycyl-radical enzyme activating protein [Desulfovibrio sp.]
MNDEAATGIIFNIQKFSVHDGEGIRTLVFLKGCPLRCAWCSNPESQSPKPEHAFNPSRCLTAQVCGRCLKACEHGALSLVNDMIMFDARRCTQCFACANACPGQAQKVYGETKSVREILDLVERDQTFYSRSGGGMTLSGGEALFQHEFTLALLRAAKRRHIDTAMETSAYAPYPYLHEACENLNKLIMDIKCMDSAKHKAFTGVDNDLILENFQKLLQDFPDLPILVRTPVVPGFNDTEEDIRAIRRFVPLKANIEYELLPYHRMGQPKYGYLCRPYALEGKKLDPKTMQKLREIAFGLPIAIPGLDAQKA